MEGRQISTTSKDRNSTPTRHGETTVKKLLAMLMLAAAMATSATAEAHPQCKDWGLKFCSADLKIERAPGGGFFFKFTNDTDEEIVRADWSCKPLGSVWGDRTGTLVVTGPVPPHSTSNDFVDIPEEHLGQCKLNMAYTKKGN
jgi:hypothetical protein